MTNTIQFRNKKNCYTKLIAEPLFASIALIALVESVVASFFTLLFLLVLPYNPAPFQRSVSWLSSSSFSLFWALGSSIVNLCQPILVADEKKVCEETKTSSKNLVPNPDLFSF